MNSTHAAFTLLAVASLAYAAGRSELFTCNSVAMAAPQDSKPGILEGIRDAAKDAAKAATDPFKDKPAATADETMMAAWMKLGAPGDHHAALEPAIGTFDAVYKFKMSPDSPWMESKGTVTREWVLGKRYVREVVEAKSDMGAFNGLGYMGYNNYDQQYEFVWMEDMSTLMLSSYGTMNPDTKTMTTYATHRDPTTGRIVNGWHKWNLSNPDRQTIEGYSIDVNGREFKSVEGVMERRK